MAGKKKKKKGPPRLHAKRSKKHPGFNAVASKIKKKSGVSKSSANKIAGAIYQKMRKKMHK